MAYTDANFGDVQIAQKEGLLVRYATWRRKDPYVEDELVVGFTIFARGFQLILLIVTLLSAMSMHGVDPLCARNLVFLLLAHLICSISYTLFVHENFAETSLKILRSFISTVLFPIMPFVHLLDYYIVARDLGEDPN